MTSTDEQIIYEESSMEVHTLKILCVGRVCLDFVHVCTEYPSEDSTQRWQRGGNASNTCTVLSLIGQPCELLACLSTDEHINFLQNDLRKYKIDYSHCPMINGIGCPVSSIILSLDTGSRTIVYHNCLPELTLKNFEQLNLEEYSWIHFEGRHIDVVLLMIQHIDNYNNSLNCDLTKNRMPITISVELESSRSGSGLLNLLSYVDVAFIAKEFAEYLGFSNMNEAIHNIGQDSKGTIVCAWSEEGAIARTSCGSIVQSPAFPPQKVIDTLGAGDTFNAAALYYLNKSKVEFMHKYKEEAACTNDNQMKDASDNNTAKRDVKENLDIRTSGKYNRAKFINETVLQQAIKFACCIAGAKVGLRGYDCLDIISSDILQSNFLEN
ncbi:PREDICTED: ketohexokinase-like isoform X2 [Acromyrmex echinatior]|uniref:ketohexokinase-like isoform X2 n=1 Tax=Acromyrmex echinatior TaxID=103372 RepID=UPI000580CF1F|nr:PREDICTED: ketohexokinase-like isoform X2 [Acromyrmex echinatior]